MKKQPSLKDVAIMGRSWGVIQSILDNIDRDVRQVSPRQYKRFTEGGVAKVRFQRAAVRAACAKSSGLFCVEMAMGSGKTYVAAWTAEHFLKRGGKVIVICPSALAMGDASFGIIKSFYKVFAADGLTETFGLGRVNEASQREHVYFFTPRFFLRLRDRSPSFFKALVRETSLLVVDEAHHFPEVPTVNGQLKVYGKIHELATSLFLRRGKKVLTLTGTHGRLDRLPVWKETPDYKFTVKNVMDVGLCPEIFGVQVFADVQAKNARPQCKDYNLNLSGKEAKKYWGQVSDMMLRVWKKWPKPTCAFVFRVADAHRLVRLFNKKSGLGARGLAALVGSTPMLERRRIVDDILAGKRLGYVTCSVGAEALDIPPLTAAHMISRTRSRNKVMQSVGRTLRLSRGKGPVLMVDYHVMNPMLVRGCYGLEELVRDMGDASKAKKLVNGGRLLENGSHRRFGQAPDRLTLGEEKGLVTRLLPANCASLKWAKMFSFAKAFRDCFGHVDPKRVAELVRSNSDPRWSKVDLRRLHIWLLRNTSRYMSGVASRALVDALTRIGFVFVGYRDRVDKLWHKSFAHYARAKRPSRTLYKWAGHQRQRMRLGKLEPNRVRLLNTIGFTWASPLSSSACFERRVRQIEAYFRKNGHCKIRGYWVTDIRRKRRKGRLPLWVRRRLDAVRFVWNPRPKLKWTSKMDAVLGQSSDPKTARRLGLSLRTVAWRRRHLCIPAWRTRTYRKV